MAASDHPARDPAIPVAPAPRDRDPGGQAGVARSWRRPKPVYPPMTFSRWWRTLGWRHLALLVAVLFALYPLAWMGSASINPIDTLSGAQLIPEGASFDNYSEILASPSGSPFVTWLLNSWKISLIVSLANPARRVLPTPSAGSASPAGAGPAVHPARPGVPEFLAFVAIFLILHQMGEAFPSIGLDTHMGLILVYLGGAVGFNTFLIQGSWTRCRCR